MGRSKRFNVFEPYKDIGQGAKSSHGGLEVGRVRYLGLVRSLGSEDFGVGYSKRI